MQANIESRSRVLDTARACIRETDDLTLKHMCDATAIPAPGGAEAARGRWFADRLHDLGLSPMTDAAGNVYAVTPCADPAAGQLVIAAHLDTVFAPGTTVDVRRDATRITAPGISDNARGLAGALAIARALHATGWPTRSPVTFVATVGEEGAGDLRGVKHYIGHSGQRTAAFIALDGAGASRIINAGVGSRRVRVTFCGAGGHSWSDWGVPNAIHAAGRAIAALAALPLKAAPRTTLSVGRIAGGTSINAIPGEAWFEVDLRSEALAPLRDLEAAVRQAIERARGAEAGARELTVAVEVFGDRPAGRTDESHALVRAAIGATRNIGLTPELASSSTDANVPMSVGIPAIAIGAGGDSGGTHTLREWYDNRGGAAGLERALLVVLETAGIAG
ncbi:MAG TPA: M20/M25/M40 family metallo-hydrolase [Longimicrobiales bacterium]